MNIKKILSKLRLAEEQNQEIENLFLQLHPNGSGAIEANAIDPNASKEDFIWYFKNTDELDEILNKIIESDWIFLETKTAFFVSMPYEKAMQCKRILSKLQKLDGILFDRKQKMLSAEARKFIMLGEIEKAESTINELDKIT